MKDSELGYRIARILDSGVDRLDRPTLSRLQAARNAALARATKASTGIALSGGGNISADEIVPGLGSWVMMVLLIVAVAGFAYWNNQQRIAEIEELDTALLADELPINAYLDNGFGEWLKRSSQP